ncbi:protealysin inhibitor emfourin [Microbacterium gorillae]|uniref:protealysin inhibitor emfourin n=1 Tax=Microbacterium gorillae TaxID=1231063 RepID=UPI00058F6DB4|nr:protealysin inhibitor emfourin [Microbacterium gorillae]
MSEAERFTLTVTRSGGIAGLTRSWRLTVPAAEAPQWAPVLSACFASAPDDSAHRASAPAGVDRFTWLLVLIEGDRERSVRTAEDELSDAARTVIERVQEDGARGR